MRIGGHRQRESERGCVFPVRCFSEIKQSGLQNADEMNSHTPTRTIPNINADSGSG